MNFGYARVSTKSQDLNDQIEQLKKSGVDDVVSEKFTGTTTNRPAFNALLDKLKTGDTLTVTKLDRFARNARQALELADKLRKRDITLNVLNLGKIDNTPMGKLTFTVFSAFAEFERDMIVTRTREGKEYAKKHDKNYHEGRKFKFSDEQIKLAYNLHKQGVTHKIIEKQTGISIPTQYRRFRELKKEEI